MTWAKCICLAFRLGKPKLFHSISLTMSFSWSLFARCTFLIVRFENIFFSSVISFSKQSIAVTFHFFKHICRFKFRIFFSLPTLKIRNVIKFRCLFMLFFFLTCSWIWDYGLGNVHLVFFSICFPRLQLDVEFNTLMPTLFFNPLFLEILTCWKLFSLEKKTF